jgi:hypothetical protein
MANDQIPIERHRLRTVHTYDVTAQELSAIERESLDVGQDFQYSLFFAGVFLTLLISIGLTQIPSPVRHADFVAVAFVSGVLAIYFGCRYRRKRKDTRNTIQEIKARQVGPVGDDSHELRPAELVKMPLVSMSGGLADSIETVVSPAPSSEEQSPSAGDQT